MWLKKKMNVQKALNMQRVSSNLTLFLKLFLPTMWIVFFTTFGVMLFIIDEYKLPLLTSAYFKYPYLLVFFIFFALLYFTFIQLKRVEMDTEYYYVSNYMKTYRLLFDDIASVDKIKLGPVIWVTYKLKAKGSFGKKITFLANTELYNMFMNDHPEIAQIIEGKSHI